MTKVSGVHHVAIGVKDLKRMMSFYQGVIGFSEVFAEFDESEQEIMRDVTRSPKAVFSGAILQQKAGGPMVEFIHMSQPLPRPIRKDFRYGDIGVSKITLAVSDVFGVYAALQDRVNFCAPPAVSHIPGLGAYPFVYCRDPEGNLVEMVAADSPAGSGDGMFAGVCSIGISVTDLVRSISFYEKQLGFDVVLDIHEGYSGAVDPITGMTGSRVRSCRLSASSTPSVTVELFEVISPRGRSLPFAAGWGDFGYLQAAFDCADVNAMADKLTMAGLDLLCSPKVMVDGIADHPGEFVYARDPDGIPVEFLYIPQ